ncbi:tautomerase family protein [Pendulispora albinea]|uniref:Tautomerase family protein n=1 Tax=Pendulispora albinea TaxID=2741071 RepID=A0ABZ2M811_9BACT
MPLVRIALRQGKSSEYRRAVADAVHEALVEAIRIPPADRFQIITEHDSESLIYDPSYLGITRTDDLVIIQITMNVGRTLDLRKQLFARIAERLAQAVSLRKEDVLISLVEVAKENWSFGNGEAQYADK